MGTDLLISEPTACFHCGEPCRDDAVRMDDKAFCCSGCKMVYDILDENELNTYYCLDEKPGISFKDRSTTGSLAGGALYMALFGLGTFPAMMVMSLAPNFIGLETRRRINRYIPLLAILLGIYLVYRGLMMHIPN